MTHWTDAEIDAILPAVIRDERGRAFARVVSDLIAQNDISPTVLRDPSHCPEFMLPVLVVEFGMQSFVPPGLPATRVREILAHRRPLKRRRGYDDGVLLGLSLMGMRASITHWHQLDPPGPENTHTIDVFSEGASFWDSSDVLTPRDIAAIQQMIEATKRLSQSTNLRVGSAHRTQLHVATSHRGVSVERRIAAPRPTPEQRSLTVRTATRHYAHAVSRHTHRPQLPEAA